MKNAEVETVIQALRLNIAPASITNWQEMIGHAQHSLTGLSYQHGELSKALDDAAMELNLSFATEDGPGFIKSTRNTTSLVSQLGFLRTFTEAFRSVRLGSRAAIIEGLAFPGSEDAKNSAIATALLAGNIVDVVVKLAFDIDRQFRNTYLLKSVDEKEANNFVEQMARLGQKSVEGYNLDMQAYQRRLYERLETCFTGIQNMRADAINAGIFYPLNATILQIAYEEVPNMPPELAATLKQIAENPQRPTAKPRGTGLDA